ncbi:MULTISPECIES: MogA/MoaB family molybdenum cofactor biosynthesis protein [unclassified Leptolyngbya]|uniref:MogA/MoaB family molybdenum cofactor biosynthesis protein n=1 Tax=unclassified Leptolyngbya TaxID=2650499 RepID=UPI00168342F0|nr:MULTISPECIES: MogA/MoaB family molybdenum cofactor biosynthesis protein [unclassified Leptolyngbya]MBD1913327.1 MogA/MoaB family molybdenum cofactor biosynthesis protein [Leptolyngbya sp. FACHB-8]MBD2154483.1 MogA/MoaB family molybdenum cofactor biosynthesis protein [Leptolyngbya sp. FACHB-16]
MTSTPHPDQDFRPVVCAIVTVSDTRTRETDTSGQAIEMALVSAGHQVGSYEILKDDPAAIATHVQSLCDDSAIAAIILNGGTGIAPRDTTYDAVERLLEKTLPGFGEIFRWLSYREIGSRAIASRAVAGIRQNTLIFSLPGARGAVVLAMENLILPELQHLIKQLNS